MICRCYVMWTLWLRSVVTRGWVVWWAERTPAWFTHVSFKLLVVLRSCAVEGIVRGARISVSSNTEGFFLSWTSAASQQYEYSRMSIRKWAQCPVVSKLLPMDCCQLYKRTTRHCATTCVYSFRIVFNADLQRSFVTWIVAGCVANGVDPRAPQNDNGMMIPLS